MTVSLTTGGLRQRKKARTRDALVEAATQLFADKGFEQTTVDEIAAVADVSRRTFFRYFESKESIAFPRYEAHMALFLEVAMASRREGSSGLAAVRYGLLALGEVMVANTEEMRVLDALISASPTLIARERMVDLAWEHAIVSVLQEGLTHPELAARARYVGAAVVGVLRVAFRDWYAADCQTDLVALGEAALDLVDSMGANLDPVAMS